MLEPWPRSTGDEKDAVELSGEGSAPLREAHFFDPSEIGHCCGVHENIYSPVQPRGGFDQSDSSFLVRDVRRRSGLHRSASLHSYLRSDLQFRTLDVADNHLRSLGGQRQCTTTADAACGSSDEGHPAIEPKRIYRWINHLRGRA